MKDTSLSSSERKEAANDVLLSIGKDALKKAYESVPKAEANSKTIREFIRAVEEVFQPTAIGFLGTLGGPASRETYCA